ncbi:MAG TPA: lytic transglycosylase domain-containing protein [Dyella sp.]|uniref:lytic transglycosylase domain-containing protein n=1 Tax=Dyella sp. TaxID=1869338 RepID=UPI002D76CB4F|nr:lytic transglycosylase domain-containing protein [Dyella sp.]HET6554251.1 lytic transglycosylase domain-containing protein [Dyella sp.]
MIQRQLPRMHPPVALRLMVACALALAWLCLPAAARAGALYRCTGSAGETVFSSSTAGYQGCSKIAGAPDTVRRKAVVARPAATLAGVQGSAETSASAPKGGAPASTTAAAPPVTSLAWAKDSVQTTAREATRGSPAPAGKPGQWSYAETSPARSGSVPDKPVASASTEGDRVLRGAVYRVVRKDGSVEYTNMRPAGQQDHAVTMLFTYLATCVACNLHSTIRWDSVALNLSAYADVIQLASQESGVDEAFLRAIIHAESAFNPRALSLKGAQGLMQLMPGTASDMGVHDAFDSAQNIRGGARYLGLLLRTFRGNEQLAAAAYNAGPGAVQRYNGVPPYDETRVYVERVGTLRKRYGQAIHTSGGKSPVVAGMSAIQ